MSDQEIIDLLIVTLEMYARGDVDGGDLAKATLAKLSRDDGYDGDDPKNPAYMECAIDAYDNRDDG